MEKRVVRKKGKLRVARQGSFIRKLAREVVNSIESYCKKIRVVGSIRRREKNPVDIDIVLIPKSRENIERILMRKGKKLQGGKKKARFRIKGVNVELYYSTPEEFGAELLAYSSKFGSGIGLRMIAKKKGFKLSQHGLFKNNKKIAGKTEEGIYKALGRKYKTPAKR